MSYKKKHLFRMLFLYLFFKVVVPDDRLSLSTTMFCSMVVLPLSLILIVAACICFIKKGHLFSAQFGKLKSQVIFSFSAHWAYQKIGKFLNFSFLSKGRNAINKRSGIDQATTLVMKLNNISICI